MGRALEEMEVRGIATVIGADLAILKHPDFAAVEHSTNWVETVLDMTGVTSKPLAAPGLDTDGAEPKVKRDMDVEVNGKRFAVSMYVPESHLAPVAAGGAAVKPRPKRGGASAGAVVAGSGKIAVPMQGTIVKVLVEAGQTVAAGEPLVVLEAMKMENNVNSDIDGTVAEVKVEPGQSVAAGEVVVVVEAAEG
jgi:acetyl-CoA/propionyl-CoA carboxylase biotin carboxyl carrier protein